MAVNDSNSNSNSAGFEECPICLEEMDGQQVVKQLPCGHMFHSLCIEAWLLNYGVTCPLDNTCLDELLA